MDRLNHFYSEYFSRFETEEYDKIQTVDNKKVEPTYKASKKTKNQNKKALP